MRMPPPGRSVPCPATVTYAEFLAVFLVPPVVVALVALRGRLPRGLLRWQIPLLVAMAVVYTAPWDRQLIVDGVWSYPAAQVAGATVLGVPIEEYGFYVLQVLLVALVAGGAWRRLERPRR